MERVEAQIEALTQRMERVEAQIEALTQRMERVEAQIEALTKRMERVEDRLGSVEERVGSLEERVGSVEGELVRVRNRLDDLTGKALEQYYRERAPSRRSMPPPSATMSSFARPRSHSPSSASLRSPGYAVSIREAFGQTAGTSACTPLLDRMWSGGVSCLARRARCVLTGPQSPAHASASGGDRR